MTSLAWIIGILGVLCALMGFVIATSIIPEVPDTLTPDLWLRLATVLMLTTIACLMGRGGRTYEED